MKLNRLKIELQKWGDDRGLYKATIEYENAAGAVELVLDPALSLDLLIASGEAITKFSKMAAEEMSRSIVESVAGARAAGEASNRRDAESAEGERIK